MRRTIVITAAAALLLAACVSTQPSRRLPGKEQIVTDGRLVADLAVAGQDAPAARTEIRWGRFTGEGDAALDTHGKGRVILGGQVKAAVAPATTSNLPSFGPRDEREGARWVVADGGGEIVSFAEAPLFSYACADSGSCTRQVYYLRPRMLLLYDRVVATDPESQVTWGLQAKSEPATEEQRARSGYLSATAVTVTNGDTTVVVKAYHPRGAKIEKKEADGGHRVEAAPEPAKEQVALHVIMIGETGKQNTAFPRVTVYESGRRRQGKTVYVASVNDGERTFIIRLPAYGPPTSSIIINDGRNGRLLSKEVELGLELGPQPYDPGKIWE